MRYRLAIPSLLAIGLALAPSAVRASVGKITLKELVDGSDLIVVATETKVEDGPANLTLGEEVISSPIKIATARVLEVWKGNTGLEVRYLASSTWICDISDVKVGERVVLFLVRQKDWPFWGIAHAGRGRMPIRDVESKSYATIWAEDVRLPAGFMTMPGPERKYEFIRSVNLSQLAWMVRSMGRTDMLIVGSVSTFALAGLTWFFSGTLPRDASFKIWLRAIARAGVLVATLFALAVLWCHS